MSRQVELFVTVNESEDKINFINTLNATLYNHQFNCEFSPFYQKNFDISVSIDTIYNEIFNLISEAKDNLNFSISCNVALNNLIW